MGFWRVLFFWLLDVINKPPVVFKRILLPHTHRSTRYRQQTTYTWDILIRRQRLILRRLGTDSIWIRYSTADRAGSMFGEITGEKTRNVRRLKLYCLKDVQSERQTPINAASSAYQLSVYHRRPHEDGGTRKKATGHRRLYRNDIPAEPPVARIKNWNLL